MSTDAGITPDAVRLSVVVPCFNEEESLGELHKRVISVCRTSVGGAYELVLVDDGSRDGTWPLMERIAATDPRIVAVRLSRNHGHQLALTAGLHVCRGERILILDADLQDPPELLPDMMRLMDGGAEVVYGQREEREGESWFKRSTATAFYRLLNQLSDTPIPADSGDFRLLSRRVLDVLKEMPEQNRFIRGMVAWVGFRQVPLKYKRDPRFAGNTKYPFRKMMRFAIDAFTSFSVAPLRVAISLGQVSLVLSLVLLAHIVYAYAFLNAVPGWSSLAVLIVFFSSVQLFTLGVIGEYIGRLFVQSRQRPLFVVSDIVTSGPAPADAILSRRDHGSPS